MQREHVYAEIILQDRKMLVELVDEQKNTIFKACQTLNMKYSTGKMIYRRFKEQGTFFTKRNYRKRYQTGNQVQQELISHPILIEAEEIALNTTVINPFQSRPLYNVPWSFGLIYHQELNHFQLYWGWF